MTRPTVVVVLRRYGILIGLLVVPLILGFVYLSVFAASRYVSQSVIVVRQTNEASAGLSGIAALLVPSDSSSIPDTELLKAYILSADMLESTNKKLNLRQAYSTPKLDFVFRLSATANREQFLSYYHDRVEVTIDNESGLLVVRTQAFDPDLSLRLNEELVRASEQFVNEISRRQARDQMAFADHELQNLSARLKKTKTALASFQDANGVLDPVAQAAANTGLTAELRASLSRLEAELTGMMAYLNDSAPQVKAAQAQIAGVRAQLEAESRRAIGGNRRLNTLASEYQSLLLDVQFAEEAYRLGLSALETARLESTRKIKSLVLVESPFKAESAEYPNRPYSLLVLLIGASLVYGIVKLVLATIADHRD